MGCCQTTNTGNEEETKTKVGGNKAQNELSNYLDMEKKTDKTKDPANDKTDISENKEEKKDESKENNSNDKQAEILLFGKDIDNAEKELRSCGGRIGIVLGSTAFVAFVPQSQAQDTILQIQNMTYCTVNRPNVYKEDNEKLVIEAWDSYQSIKGIQRSQENENWDAPHHAPMAPFVKIQPPETSKYLRDTVAVGVVIVSGPTNDLRFTRREINTVESQCLQGLSFLTQAGGWEPNIRFYFEPVEISISNPNPSNPSTLNDRDIRASAIRALGFDSVTDYVDYVKKNNSSGGETKYAFCAFFVKYSIYHFAYAIGNLLMMHYENDGWGPQNIHAVFAHEMGHVFGASDEYAGSNCDCMPSGTLAVGNFNCDNCETYPNTKIACLMKANTLRVCAWSRGQLGWNYFGWGKMINNNDSTSATPTICGFNGTLYMAWKANNNSNSIYITGTSNPFPVESGTALSWPNGVKINNTDSTSDSPTMIEFNNKLYLIWKANDDSNSIYISSIENNNSNVISGDWSKGVKINDSDSTSAAPVSCVVGNMLYLAWKANDDSNSIYISGTNNPLSGKWPNGIKINNNDSTSASPALCVFNNMLYLGWKANDNSNSIYISGTDTPLSSNWPSGVRINNNDSTSDTPSMVAFGDNLYLVWKANDWRNSMYVSGSSDPLNSNWPNGERINQIDSTSRAVSLNGFSNKVYLTWTGNDSSRRIYISETQLP